MLGSERFLKIPREKTIHLFKIIEKGVDSYFYLGFL
jgi:hypothetical protein